MNLHYRITCLEKISIGISITLGLLLLFAYPDPSSALPVIFGERPTPSPSLPKCNCDGNRTYWYQDGGKCYKFECTPTKPPCNAVGTTYAEPGLQGPSQQVDCPTKPTDGGGSSSTGGGTNTRTPPKTTTTTTIQPSCPSMVDGGDGGNIGECADGDSSPITPPYPDPSDPYSCYQNYRTCLQGCWYYDYDGQDPVPVDPSQCS